MGEKAAGLPSVCRVYEIGENFGGGPREGACGGDFFLVGSIVIVGYGGF